MHRAESEEDSTRRHGEWRLRLLLSLEDRERTRTRLLVTVVLADIMTGILDEIPSKVMSKSKRCRLFRGNICLMHLLR